MSTNDLNLVPSKCRKFAAGDKLGSGYCLIKPLPASLPGVAWLASDPDLQKELVLHFLPDAVLADAGAMEELKREVLKNRQIVHPRILRIHDLVEGEGWVALATEGAGGESIGHLLERKKFFECREVKGWLGEICSTIDDAHKGDLLHRNLSLENIRIKANGELIVANFGVSRVILDSLARASQKEPKDRKEPKPTKAEDIYAIGAVLYQLLTGTPPFSPDALAAEKRAPDLTPVSVRRKEVGIKGERILPEWEKTISLCLEKNTSLRPKNAIEVAKRLGGQRPMSAPTLPEGRPNQLTGGFAFRSTVKPGGQPEFGTSGTSAGSTEAKPEEPTVPVQPQGQVFKPAGRQYPTNVFMPVERPLTHGGSAKRNGPLVAFLLICLVLVAIAGGAYLLLSGKNPKAQTANVAEPERKESPTPAEAPKPEPSASAAPAPLVQAEVVAPTPVPTPTLPPEPPKIKVLLEPQNVPEEQSKLFKTARKSPALVDEARVALAANEKLRQEKLLVQEKMLADLKEAQAVAEKANAEVLLKQAAAGDVSKAVADLALEGEAKTKAIKDAQAETARYQAVAEQIASLKTERAVETEVPATAEAAASAVPSGTPPDAPEPNQILPSFSTPATPAVPVTDMPKGQEIINSLGMKFVPVGDVRFSIWLTRVQDFEAFATATGLRSSAWKQPGFAQSSTHPVVNVSWKEASAFCRWLTQKEHKDGTLPMNLVYRLPTDSEWSQAVGLPFEKGRSAQSRDMDVPGVYPWGTQWPPPAGTGNFTGEETGSDTAIKGYNDGFAWTSPVGSFPPNQNGLYDMAGNAWQWCMDYWNEEQKARVLRGSAWNNSALNLSLLSSCRFHSAPEGVAENYSFRCVLAPEGYQ